MTRRHLLRSLLVLLVIPFRRAWNWYLDQTAITKRAQPPWSWEAPGYGLESWSPSARYRLNVEPDWSNAEWFHVKDGKLVEGPPPAEDVAS